MIFATSRALDWLIGEKEVFDKKLTQPTLFQQSNSEQSKLKWNDKFSKRDLIELLTALDAISAITKVDGGNVSFSQLIKSTERFLNITLSRSYKTRESIVARKIKTTNFLTILKDAVIEKSAK